MLARSRSMSVVFRRQLHLRSLATSALASSSSHPVTEFSVDHHSQESSPLTEDNVTFPHVEASNESTHKATGVDSRLKRYVAFVRPWDESNTLPEIYAIVRALEREYGRVRSFNVLRVRHIHSTFLLLLLLKMMRLHICTLFRIMTLPMCTYRILRLNSRMKPHTNAFPRRARTSWYRDRFTMSVVLEDLAWMTSGNC